MSRTSLAAAQPVPSTTSLILPVRSGMYSAAKGACDMRLQRGPALAMAMQERAATLGPVPAMHERNRPLARWRKEAISL